MLKLIFAVTAFITHTYAISADVLQDMQGSNSTNSERICMISNSSQEAFKESLKNCRRGDVIALGSVTNLGAMKYCDFTKTMMYENGKILACVFTGYERTTTK